ncbi:hypothetical protein [Georgenia muralis]|uniref:Uncharacterized protein n=1 Tax=Georgenia muralis TaxID=154117 RepID=A0A3N4ZNC4_9MICO|nr:hypothetical protein [Georgenia muralis]RPF27208.1 hypothetical protein EDD32_1679 [Georgenia muralis]
MSTEDLASKAKELWQQEKAHAHAAEEDAQRTEESVRHAEGRPQESQHVEGATDLQGTATA